MDLYRLQELSVTAYEQVMAWGETNPLLSGMIIGVVLFGSLSYALNSGGRTMRKQGRLHRLLRGAQMRRSRNRLAFERTKLEDAIEDCLFEMEYQGETTKESADIWRNSFALHYQMDGLLPKKAIGERMKKVVTRRVEQLRHSVHPMIPGGLPEVVVDKTYDPPSIKMKSKFAT